MCSRIVNIDVSALSDKFNLGWHGESNLLEGYQHLQMTRWQTLNCQSAHLMHQMQNGEYKCTALQ